MTAAAKNLDPVKLTNEDWLGIEREWLRRSLAEFVKEAWHVLEPNQPYVHGWHVEVICEHLEAITNGDIRRLLINIPPGTMKSTLCNVFWPAWEWGARGVPANRIISASHVVDLAIRDTLKMRRLITSDWYQALWPIKLTSDQNAKLYYENEATGWRQACPVKNMTGKRGDRVVWDDPHSVEDALSIAGRTTALREFRETLPTRLNNPDRSAIVIVMQRLHEADVSGFILENDDIEYEHLCLPMEFDKTVKCKTSIGFTDPRKKEGELLFPERFPPSVIKEYKSTLGAYGYAGQMQQKPAPRTDGFFEWDRIELVDVEALPKMRKIIRYWDKAGTEGGGARTAGVKLGVCHDGIYWVMHVTAGQWGAPKRERIIRQTAESDGKRVQVWIEQEPGSGGKESAEATIANLAGFSVYAERPTGDKETRAEPYSVQVEAGRVRMVKGAWNELFIDEHKTYPVGKFKDQIDAASGAFNKLAASKYTLANI